ncbi:rhomboid protease GluP [Lachnospiraceae bacterium PM6-15]|uniref:Rhomboid family intramembrane serine protease n=1 Tax=Ohessyouella blattaphilus TaxID=2949333 RepID=A0ABT1EH54_9FIRM|nr:rhomboid family intramembrane serine protease [Ohessyouella blattaphilus]MCP1110018.1 rhomboid family intramembrane serine protease [Ohessyouella blattaphilus]MCR8563412.1 rhomboid family intramembrane serine protease [Ohessyouella blattaphilus]
MTNAFKNYPVTLILIGVNVAIFLGLSMIGQTEDGYFMLEHGASYVPFIIENGEYYRLFTCMFLHFGFSHLANNMLSLGLYGTILEREVGTLKMIVIYLVSGLGASALSAGWDYFTESYSISAGASGAIFGLMGALIYVAIRNKGRIGNLGSNRLIMMALFSLYYGYTSTGVDNLAHLGGLIFGVLIAILVYHPKKKRNKYQQFDWMQD